MAYKFVGLISGGKDSCFNMMQCISAGHSLMAIANLAPENKDELDSYMYQSVGHMGIDLYSEAIGVPLYRRKIKGSSLNIKSLNYSPTPGDEVEDLFELLKQVKEECGIEAVSVGAILSDYQRIRVENVCSRLELVSLSYLWRRDQSELLEEIISCKVEAILIKVAAIGLLPSKHLGKTIEEMKPHLEKLNEKYGVNVCGEGGEYETFTLDCPLFKKKIVVDEFEVFESSGDVGYLNFKKLKLEEKPNVNLNESQVSDVSEISNESLESHDSGLDESVDSVFESYIRLYLELEEVSQPCTRFARLLLKKLDYPVTYKLEEKYNEDFNGLKEFNSNEIETAIKNSNESRNLFNIIKSVGVKSPLDYISQFNFKEIIAKSTAKYLISEETMFNRDYRSTDFGLSFHWVSVTDNSMERALFILSEKIKNQNLQLNEIVNVKIFINDMKDYTQLNSKYIKYFSEVSPTRACIQADIDKICIEALFCKHDDYVEKESLHVQSISHWAPASIGPYSQAVKIGDFIFVAGVIGLVPGYAALADGFVAQTHLALIHLYKILQAMNSMACLGSIVQGICYVNSLDDVPAIKKILEIVYKPMLLYVEGTLPKNAMLELDVWAHLKRHLFMEEKQKENISEDIEVDLRLRSLGNNCAVLIVTITKSDELKWIYKNGVFEKENPIEITPELIRNIIRMTVTSIINSGILNSDTNLANLKNNAFYPVNSGTSATAPLNSANSAVDLEVYATPFHLSNPEISFSDLHTACDIVNVEDPEIFQSNRIRRRTSSESFADCLSSPVSFADYVAHLETSAVNHANSENSAVNPANSENHAVNPANSENSAVNPANSEKSAVHVNADSSNFVNEVPFSSSSCSKSSMKIFFKKSVISEEIISSALKVIPINSSISLIPVKGIENDSVLISTVVTRY